MQRILKFVMPASLTLVLAACGGQVNDSVPGSQALPQSHQAQSARAGVPNGLQFPRHYMRVFDNKVQPLKKLSGLLNYGGGLVQLTPTIYVIYWKFNGKGDPGKAEQGVLNPFLQGVSGSAWLNTLTQYYDTSGNITNPPGEYTNKLNVGYILDNKTKVPANPTDAEVQGEAEKLVNKFGANPDAAYIVATPHGHSSSGFGTEFCAYHSIFSYQGTLIAYVNFPYQSDGGQACGVGFVNSPGTYDGVSIISGHELAETQTDPGADNSGWGGSMGEVADICAWDSTTSDQPFSTGSFPVQPLYSDTQKACVLSGP